MKKILAFFVLCILCLCPILANADSCSNHDNDRSGCLSLGGCKWTPDNNNGDGFCNECSPGYANAPCSGSNCPESCQDCASEWQHYSSGQIYNPHDPHANGIGLSYCPWKCDDGFFQFSSTECSPCPPADGNGGGSGNGWYITLQSTQATTVIETAIANSCSCDGSRTLIKTTDPSDANKFRYYCGGCGAGIASSAGGPTTCTCVTDSNRKYGNVTMEIANDPSSNTIGGAYAHYECQCPEHSSHSARSANTDPNDPTSAACVCSGGFTMIETTSQQHQCSPCPTNAETYNNSANCTCNEHYYGTLNNNTGECRRCPIGTTIERGRSNTTKADCHVSCNTKFYTNNTNYMRLIPSGNDCSISGEQHQTYNGPQAHGVH